jgi:hypothetical protein
MQKFVSITMMVAASSLPLVEGSINKKPSEVHLSISMYYFLFTKFHPSVSYFSLVFIPYSNLIQKVEYNNYTCLGHIFADCVVT